MSFSPVNNPLILAKLYRPELSRDYIRRTRLLDWFDSSRDSSLFLISAPAGYGKTTLAASIAAEIDHPNAWLSLSKDDNDLSQFLAYLGAAIRIVKPGSMRVTSSLIASPNLPPLPEIIRVLSNELGQIKSPYFIVLDDYHYIHEASVHEVLTHLLRHPPKPMHLVLCTRRDPPLPLDSLRAKGQLVEFRLRDLRFTKDESALFLRKNGVQIEGSMIDYIDEQTEGWAAGLRLIALSNSLLRTDGPKLEQLKPKSRYVREYLIKEVISDQPEAVQDYLISSAFLPRFCASLSEAIVSPSSKEMDGQRFIDWLEKANIFIVPLDQEHRWFRFHHLFQDTLRGQGKSRYGPGGIAAIHGRACAWFDENGFYQEAVEQAVEQGDGSRAVEVFIRRRHDLMNEESWHALERLLLSLPEEEQMNQIELLVQRAWCCENRFRFDEFEQLLDQIKNRSRLDDSVVGLKEDLAGEILALDAARSYYLFDGKKAACKASAALKRIPVEHASVRAFALVVRAMALQMTGDFRNAHVLLQRSLEKAHLKSPTYQGRILTAMNFVYWLQADLSRLRLCATRQLKVGEDADLTETESFAHYFLGICHYHLNQLDVAKKHLVSAIELSSATNFGNYFHSAFALTLVHQAEGNSDTASQLEESIMARAYELGITELIRLAEAFQVELRLRQGSTVGTEHLVQSYRSPSLGLMTRFYVPDLTYVRALIARGNPEDLKQAEERLDELRHLVEETNNRHLLIDVSLLKSLFHASRGAVKRALSELEIGVALAKEGGLVRSFLDLGKPLADLLVLLAHEGTHVSYVGKLLRAFRKEASQSISGVPKEPASTDLGSEFLVEPLTTRELEMLSLVSEGLRNREIADRLFVSHDTVKKHLYNAFQKLSVNTRRKAVARARELGLLQRRGVS